MKKKLLPLTALLCGLLFTACSQKPEADPAKSGHFAPTEQTYTVGIAQLVQHPALDQATKGFKEQLQEQFGDRVVFDEQNASGDVSTVSTIINRFVSNEVDLILANATPPLQTAAAATSTIPILGTSITDYGTALELEDFQGTVGGNVSGTSDLSPIDQQAKLFSEWFPDAKKVGLIFSTSEANSAYQVEVMTAELRKLGYEVQNFSFTDSNDLPAVVAQAVQECDVLYEPTDNVASSNAEAIANIVLPAKVPVITAESEPCKVFGVATLSIDYEQLGRQTGKMAAEILRGEKNISEMPIAYAPSVHKMMNGKICKLLGITPPEGYEVIPGTEAE